MPKIEIVSESPLLMAELKEALQKTKDSEGELSFRSSRTLDHLNLFIGLSAKDSEALRKKVEALEIPRLKPEHIIKIVDLLPAKPEEVKVVLQGYPITVTAESLKKIADEVKEYSDKSENVTKKKAEEYIKRVAEEAAKKEAEAKAAVEEAAKKAAEEAAKSGVKEEESSDDEEYAA